MRVESLQSRWPSRAAEATVVALTCLSPWAFGSVEAWAVLGLDVGVVLLAATGLWAAPGGAGGAFKGPGLALAALACLALAQSAAVPAGALRWLDPEAAAARSRLLPAAPERVAGDGRPPVALPAASLSRDREASADVAARLAAAWVVFGAVWGIGGGTGALRRFGVAVTANAVLLALFAVVQALTWNGKIYWVRPSPQVYAWFTGGPFVSHNHLAAYLNLGLGFALGFLLPGGESRGPGRAGGWGSRVWAAYAVGVIVAGVVASQSRGGFVAMAAGLAVFGAATAARTGSVVRVGAAAAGVVAFVALLLAALGDSSFLGRLTSIGHSSSIADRVEIWGGALRAWWTAPAFGRGFGAFAVATAPFFRHDRGVIFTRAENEYLDVLVEGGVVGLGLALALAVGVARSGVRALRRASTAADRGLTLGALFGLVTLAVQSLSDFCLHIPGVAVAAVALAAYVCRLGAVAPAAGVGQARGAGRRSVPAGLPLAGLGALALALVVAGHGLRLARAEALYAGSGSPGADFGRFEVDPRPVTADDLGRRRAWIEAALRVRPDWAEGHLRNGLTMLGQYQAMASEAVAGAPGDGASAALTDPLWLHGSVHSAEAGRPVTAESLLAHDPVRLYLVPAARSFLEARRCAPTLALPHARLAGLDFLLAGGDSTADYAGRALGLAGSQTQILMLASQAAAQAGDLALAASGWRRALAAGGVPWEDVADAAGAVLTPDAILDGVLPGRGRLTQLFAERLFPGPDPADAGPRSRLLRAALERLPGDGLPDAERLRTEGLILARLGDPTQARERLEGALALEPGQLDWRQDLVALLLDAGATEAARREALAGLSYAPDDPELRQAVEAATDAIARGGGGGTRPGPDGLEKASH